MNGAKGRDARMCNDRPFSSRCADSDQVPRKLTALISQAGSADALLALFAAHSTSLNHIHAANLWNKLGKQRVERRHEERLEQLVQRTLDLVSSCRARELANVAHGVAKCGLQVTVVRPLFVAVAEAAVRRGLDRFNPQNLANTVWAYATAGVAADALYAAVAEEAVRSRLARFNPQNLANTVWAYATAGVAADALYATVAEAAVRTRLAGFNPQALANTAWAYATAGVAADALFTVVAEVAVRSRLAGFNPKNLANTVCVGVCDGGRGCGGAVRGGGAGGGAQRAGGLQPSEPGQHSVGVCEGGRGCGRAVRGGG